MKNEKKTFRSRISVLLVVFILAIFIPTGIHEFQQQSYSGLYGLGGCFLFTIIIFGGMRYIISGEKLYLKMWFIPNGSKDIKDIVSIKRSYNPLSSPAGSLKRLSINFASSSISWLISPVREKEFIEALRTISPKIDVHIPETTGKWRIWDWDF